VGDTSVNVLSTTPTSTGTTDATAPGTGLATVGDTSLNLLGSVPTGTGIVSGTGLTAALDLPLTSGTVSVGLGLPTGVVNPSAVTPPVVNPPTVTPGVVDPPFVNAPSDAQGFVAPAASVPSTGTVVQAGAASATAAIAVGAETAVLASTGFNGLWLLFGAALLLLGLIVMVGSRKIRAAIPA
jgi:hypothetical protein